MSVVRVSDISKTFKGQKLYDGASMTIEEGSITAVVGPNGSGKSVLFRLICGFMEPDTGEIKIDPRFMSKGRDFPEHFGIVIDRPGYLAGKSGLKNLLELAEIRGVIKEPEVRKTMKLIGLDPDNKKPVRKYSLGMKQKLALAQAIMENPKVLVLDEPFNALDSDSVLLVRNLLGELNQAGVTIIFTSHNQADIDELATKIFEISGQKIIEVPISKAKKR